MAIASSRLPALAQRLSLLQGVPLGWHLGETSRRSARASEGSPQEESPAQHRDSRRPVAQEYRRGWSRARLRRRQESEGQSKRHLLVDTEGFVLKAKVHSAKLMAYEGIKPLLDRAKRSLPHLSHLWMDGGYTVGDKGGDWVEKTLGWKAEIVS